MTVRFCNRSTVLVSKAQVAVYIYIYIIPVFLGKLSGYSSYYMVAMRHIRNLACSDRSRLACYRISGFHFLSFVLSFFAMHMTLATQNETTLI